MSAHSSAWEDDFDVGKAAVWSVPTMRVFDRILPKTIDNSVMIISK